MRDARDGGQWPLPCIVVLPDWRFAFDLGGATCCHGKHMESFRIFVKVAELGSFADAARELGLAPATVTRKVQALEKRLGIRLLTRTTRLCRLTLDGEAFYEKARQIVDIAEEAEAEAAAAADGASGLLRVSAPISFGRRKIAPICADFAREWRNVRIDLTLTDASDDLLSREVDVALRVGPPQNGDFITRRVLRARRVICAAPSYLAEHGTPTTPDDLDSHAIIALRRDEQLVDHWMFDCGEGMSSRKVRAALSSNSGEVVEEWGLAGLGVMLKSLWDVEDHLAAGRLVELLSDTCRERADIFLLFPDRKNLPRRTRLFVDFIAGRLGEYGDRLSGIDY